MSASLFKTLRRQKGQKIITAVINLDTGFFFFSLEQYYKKYYVWCDETYIWLSAVPSFCLWLLSKNTEVWLEGLK